MSIKNTLCKNNPLSKHYVCRRIWLQRINWGGVKIIVIIYEQQWVYHLTNVLVTTTINSPNLQRRAKVFNPGHDSTDQYIKYNLRFVIQVTSKIKVSKLSCSCAKLISDIMNSDRCFLKINLSELFRK